MARLQEGDGLVKIQDVKDPTANQDVATKSYVDGLVAGVHGLETSISRTNPSEIAGVTEKAVVDFVDAPIGTIADSDTNTVSGSVVKAYVDAPAGTIADGVTLPVSGAAVKTYVDNNETDTTYTAGTGITIDTDNEVSVTNPFTDADETRLDNANITALIAAANPVFTDTDTNTTYTGGAGIDIDAANEITTDSTIATQTDVADFFNTHGVELRTYSTQVLSGTVTFSTPANATEVEVGTAIGSHGVRILDFGDQTVDVRDGTYYRITTGQTLGYYALYQLVNNGGVIDSFSQGYFIFLDGTDVLSSAVDGTAIVIDSDEEIHPFLYHPFTGATASADGLGGLVPTPSLGDEDKVLKGDGTWADEAGGVIADGSINEVKLNIDTVGTDGQVLTRTADGMNWEDAAAPLEDDSISVDELDDIKTGSDYYLRDGKTNWVLFGHEAAGTATNTGGGLITIDAAASFINSGQFIFLTDQPTGAGNSAGTPYVNGDAWTVIQQIRLRSGDGSIGFTATSTVIYIIDPANLNNWAVFEVSNDEFNFGNTISSYNVVSLIASSGVIPDRGTEIRMEADNLVSGLTGFTLTTGDISSLNDLTDVTITSPTDNQVLTHDGTGWVNEDAAVAMIADGSINEVKLNIDTAGTDGQVLTRTADGMDWEDTAAVVLATKVLSPTETHSQPLAELRSDANDNVLIIDDQVHLGQNYLDPNSDFPVAIFQVNSNDANSLYVTMTGDVSTEDYILAQIFPAHEITFVGDGFTMTLNADATFTRSGPSFGVSNTRFIYPSDDFTIVGTPDNVLYTFTGDGIGFKAGDIQVTLKDDQILPTIASMETNVGDVLAAGTGISITGTTISTSGPLGKNYYTGVANGPLPGIINKNYDNSDLPLPYLFETPELLPTLENNITLINGASTHTLIVRNTSLSAVGLGSSTNLIHVRVGANDCIYQAISIEQGDTYLEMILDKETINGFTDVLDGTIADGTGINITWSSTTSAQPAAIFNHYTNTFPGATNFTYRSGLIIVANEFRFTDNSIIARYSEADAPTTEILNALTIGSVMRITEAGNSGFDPQSGLYEITAAFTHDTVNNLLTIPVTHLPVAGSGTVLDNLNNGDTGIKFEIRLSTGGIGEYDGTHTGLVPQPTATEKALDNAYLDIDGNWTTVSAGSGGGSRLDTAYAETSSSTPAVPDVQRLALVGRSNVIDAAIDGVFETVSFGINQNYNSTPSQYIEFVFGGTLTPGTIAAGTDLFTFSPNTAGGLFVVNYTIAGSVEIDTIEDLIDFIVLHYNADTKIAKFGVLEKTSSTSMRLYNTNAHTNNIPSGNNVFGIQLLNWSVNNFTNMTLTITSTEFAETIIPPASSFGIAQSNTTFADGDANFDPAPSYSISNVPDGIPAITNAFDFGIDGTTALTAVRAALAADTEFNDQFSFTSTSVTDGVISSLYTAKAVGNKGAFTFSLLGGMNNTPSLVVSVQGTDDIPAMGNATTYTVTDGSGSESTSFTNFVTSASDDDSAIVAASISTAIGNVTETPINYTPSLSGSTITLTADVGGASAGDWTVTVDTGADTDASRIATMVVTQSVVTAGTDEIISYSGLTFPTGTIGDSTYEFAASSDSTRFEGSRYVTWDGDTELAVSTDADDYTFASVNRESVFTATEPGLVPAPDGVPDNSVIRADGNWGSPLQADLFIEDNNYNKALGYNDSGQLISIHYTGNDPNIVLGDFFKEFRYNASGDLTQVRLYPGDAIDNDNLIYVSILFYTNGILTTITKTLS